MSFRQASHANQREPARRLLEDAMEDAQAWSHTDAVHSYSSFVALKEEAVTFRRLLDTSQARAASQLKSVAQSMCLWRSSDM